MSGNSSFLAHEIVHRATQQYPTPFVYVFWDHNNHGVISLLVTYLPGRVRLFPGGPLAPALGRDFIPGSSRRLLLAGDLVILSTFQRVTNPLRVALPRILYLISELQADGTFAQADYPRPFDFALEVDETELPLSPGTLHNTGAPVAPAVGDTWWAPPGWEPSQIIPEDRYPIIEPIPDHYSETTGNDSSGYSIPPFVIDWGPGGEPDRHSNHFHNRNSW